jgi:DNA recombination protein RmuC
VSAEDLPPPPQVEAAPRQLQAPELVDSEYEALLAALREEPPPA